MIKYRFVCVKLHYHVWEVTPNKETLFPALVMLAVIVWKAHQPPVSQLAAPDEVQGGQSTLISSGPLSGCEGERRGCRATTTQETACHVVFTPYLPRETKEEMAPVKTTSVVTRFLFAGAFPPSLSAQVE